MKLKLDENLGERGRALLADCGHDVSTVPHQSLQAATDGHLVEACRREDRALVSLDLDFANPLKYRPADYPGIAVLRLPKKATPADLLSAVQTLADGLKQFALRGNLWIVEIGRIREFQASD